MKIVIVESEQQTRETIEKTVKTALPDAVLAGNAENGRDGRNLIRAEKPDLVIMDIRLPGMGGLSMLRKLRAEKNNARVLIVTADTDFGHARQAITLGVDDYILKPFSTAQLRTAILRIRDKVREEQTLGKAFSLENIFTGCLNGQLAPDRQFHQMTREKFGFTLEDPGALFVVWLGSGYTEQREQVCSMLEKAGAGQGFSVCPVPVDTWHLVAAAVYRTDQSGAALPSDMGAAVFREQVVPVLSGSIRGEVVCLWEETEHMCDFPEALRNLRQIREWNLLFDRGSLIRRRDVEEMEIVPLKYPAALEAQVRRAVLDENGEEIKKCYYRLYDLFRAEPHSPRDIKECLIRFNLSVLGAYKTRYEVKSELSVQHSMHLIAEAISWKQVRTAMQDFFDVMEFNAFGETGDAELSDLVRKAVQLVRKHYDQGIRLEEIASRLFVSEEYLSAQFKKETGMGFAETVRMLRIERIKSLLAGTRLKLNQIAELTGYTDPKYMSRVFKEEVGMLPTEFRKMIH